MNKFGKNLLIIFFVCLFVFPIYFAKSESALDIQNTINTKKNTLSNLNAQIANYQAQLNTIGQDKNTLNKEIKLLTIESAKLNTDIKLSQAKISETNSKIDSLGTSIQNSKNSIYDLKSAIAKNIKEINAEDNSTLSGLVISTKSFSDAWHYFGEQSSFKKGMREKVLQLQDTMTALTVNKTKVESAKKDLVALSSQLKDQHTITIQTQNQKNILLQSTKNKEANYQKLLTQNLALKQQMETDISNYESKLKYVLNSSLLPPVGSSPFAWPLDKIIITQLFGKTVDSVRLYSTGTHNGVDFGASVGTPVKAMADGVVDSQGNSDLSCPKASYGKWILIKYDNGLASIYGHLSLIKASNGTRVSTGDVVGYSGSTGYATGPHLHLGVYAKDGVLVTSFPSKACKGRMLTIPVAAANVYLDPMEYLPKQ